MSKSFIMVEVSSDSNDDYYDDPNRVITVIENPLDLAKHVVSELSLPAIKILLQNEYFVKLLDQLGYRDVNRLINVADRIKLDSRYYLWHQNDNGWGGQHLNEVNLDKLTTGEVGILSRQTSLLLQSINKESLKEINKDAYKSYKDSLKRIEASRKAANERAINRALKLLEENNVNFRINRTQIEKDKKIQEWKDFLKSVMCEEERRFGHTIYFVQSRVVSRCFIESVAYDKIPLMYFIGHDDALIYWIKASYSQYQNKIHRIIAKHRDIFGLTETPTLNLEKE